MKMKSVAAVENSKVSPASCYHTSVTKAATSHLVVASVLWLAGGCSHFHLLASSFVSLASALSFAFLQLRVSESCAVPELIPLT